MTEQEKKMDREGFKEAYLLHLLRNGKEPVTVFKFCEEIKTDEKDFYEHFNSFGALEKQIWGDFFDEVNQALTNDEEYEHYSAHEKVLSFLYTLLEVYKQNRSYVVLRFKDVEYKMFRPWFLAVFREKFSAWIKDVISDGLTKEEIAQRPIITSKYDEVIWGQFLYITKVWVNDESEGFQVSDAAVEKTSALLFEMMKKGPVDLLIDFLKFAYQNKAY